VSLTGIPAAQGRIEESAEELYEHAPCGYLSTLPDGTIVGVNGTLLDWLGYSREALLGRCLRDLLQAAGKLFYETHYAPLLRLQGFAREVALDLLCANGRVLPVLVTSVQQPDASGGGIIRSTIFDATERRLYERELVAARRRAEQLASVVESSADAIFMLGPDAKVQSWNRGAEQLFGYRMAEAVGRSIRELIVPEGLTGEFEHALELLRSGVPVQMETVRQHKDGMRMDVSLGLTPHIEPPGELVAISAIIRDITEWRELESRLRRAEQLQSVATLAGGVAHEVNNQMAVVLGFGEFVLRALGSEHPQARDVGSMVRAAAQAAEISRQLLAFSRQQPSIRRDVHLGELVEGLAPELRRELGAEHVMVIHVAGREDTASVDPLQVEQILRQLVRNARDAMSRGGQLTISTERIQLMGADAAAHPGDDVVPGDYVLLSVSDTGAGMDDLTLRRAFEPFFTTKQVGQGTGLGLAMVHGLVKQHGGHVWASSEPGQGTTVQVYLPVGAEA
jgi:PAS domain S-box-containing protein